MIISIWIPSNQSFNSEIKVSASLIQYLKKFSPIVSIDQPPYLSKLNSLNIWDRNKPSLYYGLNIEITQTEKLYKGRYNLLKIIYSTLLKNFKTIKIACANNLSLAWALSRFSEENIAIEHNSFLQLKQYPLESLRLPPTVITELNAYGINNLSSLFQIPANDLLLRLGQKTFNQIKEFADLYVKKLSPVKELPKINLLLTLNEEIHTKDQLVLIVKKLLKTLVYKLEEKRLACLEIEFIFRSKNSILNQFLIKFLYPKNQLDSLFKRTSLYLDQLQLPELTSIELNASKFSYCEEHSKAFSTEYDSSTLNCEIEKISRFKNLLDEIKNNSKQANLVQLLATPSHLPEEAFKYSKTEGWTNHYFQQLLEENKFTLNSRPSILLKHPLPIKPLFLLREDLPFGLKYKTKFFYINAQSSLEKISVSWWTKGSISLSDPTDREYFTFTLNSGVRIWVFKQVKSFAPAKWYLQGVWT